MRRDAGGCKMAARAGKGRATIRGDRHPMNLKGKTALVTGSTSGIGLAVARALAGEGANIALNGFGDAGEIEAIRYELEQVSGGRALYSGADLTRPEQIETMFAETAEALGAVDILV